MISSRSILFIIAVTASFLFSCSSKNKQGDAIARVYDNYLYAADVNHIVPVGTAPDDSAALMKKYISNWVNDMLVLKKAEQNLTDGQKEVEKQLRDYRNSLIMFAYEKELVSQKLDTIVTAEQIEQYYNANQNNFELKDNIVKVTYVKVNKKAPNVLKVQQWYKSTDLKDKELLLDYCRQYAENFYVEENSWLLFDDLLKEIPVQPAYNKELFLQNNRFIEVSDSVSMYFVNIRGFKIKNSISPLAFEKDNIRNIIVNKRKLDLINKMKEEVFKEAELEKDFEVF